LKNAKRGAIIAVIIAVLVVLGAVALTIYVNYIQIKEIGEQFTKIFWINLNMGVLAWIISFVFVFAVLLINGFLLRTNLNNSNVGHWFRKRWVVVLVFGIVALLLSGIFGHDFAQKILLFNNSVSFGVGDPIFYKDIGYYVFQRPFLIDICNSAAFIVAFSFFVNIFAYFFFYIQKTNSKISSLWRMDQAKGIATHVIATVLLFFAIKALSFQFSAQSLLTQSGSIFTGAGYTDVHVWLLYYRIAPYVMLAVVVVAIAFLMASKTRATIATILVFPVFMIAFGIVATLVQSFIVSPNEAVKESPYIQNAINFTQAAYNIDSQNLTSQVFPVDNSITAKDIANNGQIVNNIRITDNDENIQTLNQIQNIRNYYSFFGSSITTYTINGAKTACFVSPREINTGNLPASAKNYINLTMKYTHGLGVVMNPVSAITSEGQPDTVIQNIPPTSINGATAITQPRIYYGQNTTNYAIVDTKNGEMDDISGDGYQYSGSAGIKLSFWNRVIFTLDKGDFNILISGQITSDSKILPNRQVVQRAQKALPFLQIDSDPSLVVADDGTLVWVLDGYTSTNAYPYAEYTGEINYMRDAVKVLVDAYNGTVTAYIIDPTDPIIQAYNKMYPGVLQSGPLPVTIINHISYPEALFSIQANILTKYHVSNPLDFYQKDDLWAVATEKTSDDSKTQPVDPYYCMIQLDNATEPELVAMLPYTMAGKDNLASWFAVRCESANYGQMVLYTFPDGQNVYGTSQVENTIDTDPTISKDLTLWGQGGSSVVRGNIMVIPIKNSLLYVEPIYLTSGTNGISEVKGVVAAFNGQVVMQDTLSDSLASLFGAHAVNTTEDQNVGAKQTINQIATLWQQYAAAEANGDYATAGSVLAQLNTLIPQLQAYAGQL